MSSTDDDWREWGRRDPYFAVLTDPRFRQGRLGEAERESFFKSGDRHVEHLLAMVHRLLGVPRFTPARALDFGCGVGRILIPLARIAGEVTGVDISAEMLDEARRNCAQAQVANARFALSDDTLSRVEGTFDLVHTFIVLQHVDVERGRALFQRLVQLVAPGGVGVLHVTYAKTVHAETYGRPPASVPSVARFGPLRALLRRLRLARKPKGGTHADPLMQMNCYPLNDLLFILQQAGQRFVQFELTDHGGELGAIIYFRKPAATPP